MAVKFGRLFAERDLQGQLGHTSGFGMAWHLRCCPIEIGVFASEKLTGLQLGVRHEYMDRLADLLAAFEPSATHLFDTTNYHVFYDGATCLGFEKAVPAELPPLPPTLTGTAAVELSCPAAFC